jgi:hypothetical protein
MRGSPFRWRKPVEFVFGSSQDSHSSLVVECSPTASLPEGWQSLGDGNETLLSESSRARKQHHCLYHGRTRDKRGCYKRRRQELPQMQSGHSHSLLPLLDEEIFFEKSGPSMQKNSSGSTEIERETSNQERRERECV